MAVTTARMMGWKTESFREKSFFHYRHLGTAERSVLSSLFSYGEKDYYLGGHPVWELFRVAYRAYEAAISPRGLGVRAGLLLGFSPPDTSSGLSGTYGLSPQRTDDQAQGHPEICPEIQADR